MSPNTDERLLSCGNSASNLPEIKSSFHSLVIKQGGWRHVKILKETFIKVEMLFHKNKIRVCQASDTES